MARPGPFFAPTSPTADRTAVGDASTGCHSHQRCDTITARAAVVRRPAPDGRAPSLQGRHSPGHRTTPTIFAGTGVGMFDAFIINRIRRERRHEKERRIPLHIEAPRRRAPEPHERRQGSDPDTVSKRGIVTVDYSI